MASTSEEPSDRKETPVVEELTFNTKKIDFLGTTTPIILQNKNGPCPLLAIGNLLLLRGKLRLSPFETVVSESRLRALVSDCLIGTISKVQGKDAKCNVDHYEAIGDAIDLLPGLQTGMDVNVKFNRISDFDWESTREHIIFELLNIPIYHGWLVDPSDSDAARAIGERSYNKLQEDIASVADQIPTDVLKMRGTANRTSANDSTAVDTRTRYIVNWLNFEPDPVTGLIPPIQGELMDKFLKENASQLTAYGLSRLRTDIGDHELCVFFRNNHFSTMFKYEDRLYLLVTDEGYKDQPNVVWERLNEVKGNTVFVKSTFKRNKIILHEIEEVSSEEENADHGKNVDLGKNADNVGLGENPHLDSVFDFIEKHKAAASEEAKLKSDPPGSFPPGFVAVGPQSAQYSVWPRQPKPRSTLLKKGSKKIKEKCELM